MKPQNRYDIFIEKLSKEFAQIKNFHLTQEEGDGKVIFNFIVKRLAEINSFKTLFTQYYLKAASRSVIDDLNEIQKSKYRHLIVITIEDLKENYYETIRLGYIGMFHKYENYVDDLILHSELLISELNETGKTLPKYIEENFNYKIKDWKNSPTISRLNWISICNKHYDGYPRKKPVPLIYQNLPENERMKFTNENFIADIDLLISHYTILLQTVFFFAIHKMTFEGETYELNELSDRELTQKLIDGKSQMDEYVHKLIELNKQI